MKTFVKWPILILMAIVTMCFLTACGGKDSDDLKDQKTEVGVHRITVEFSGNVKDLDAEVRIYADRGIGEYSDIFMNNKKVNERPGEWDNANEDPKVRNYELESDAGCWRMTARVSLYGKKLHETVFVRLKGYVNGVQKNEQEMKCRPGESWKTISFAADGQGYED